MKAGSKVTCTTKCTNCFTL